MTSFSTLLSVHLISIALSVGLLTLRFWLRYQKHPQAFARWTRIVPPVVDTLLLLSGIALMAKAHIQPFSGQAQWLTEKLFGVIIYRNSCESKLDHIQVSYSNAPISAPLPKSVP